MNISGLSTHGLLLLHDAISRALAADDATIPPAQKDFLVREYPDWRIQADSIETELRRREVSFVKLRW